jgi:hypothetical protein
MKLFRLRRKSKSRKAEKELVLDTAAEGNPDPPADAPQPQADPTPDPEAGADASAEALGAAPAAEAPEEAPAAEAPEDAAATEPPAEAPKSQDSLLAQISDEANSEMAAEEEAVQPGGDPGSEDDPLDPGLLDLFRDARNEVQESTLVAELDDVSTQELLDELASVSSRLGISAQERSKDAEAAVDEPSDEVSDAGEPDDPPGFADVTTTT